MGISKSELLEKTKASPTEILSLRQRQIYIGLQSGLTIAELVIALGIDAGTIRAQLRRIADKLNIPPEKRLRHWLWVEGLDRGSPVFQIPDIVMYHGKELSLDVNTFLELHDLSEWKLYPMRMVLKEMGQEYVKLYCILWHGMSLAEVAEACSYSPKTVSYHIDKLKKFLLANTDFTAYIFNKLGISQHSLRAESHLQNWVESLRMRLTEEENAIYGLIIVGIISEAHDKVQMTQILNESLAPQYRARYTRRTVGNILERIARKHEMTVAALLSSSALPTVESDT